MTLKTIILIVTTSIGGAIGWRCGTFGGIMGSYLVSVLGSTAGLYLGRKVQKALDGD